MIFMLAVLVAVGLPMVWIVAQSVYSRSTDFLSEQIRYGDELDRLRAAEGLGGRIDEPGVVALLIGALSDSEVDVRSAAARSLGQGRARSAPAVDALIEATEDASSSVRFSAAETLGRIGRGDGAVIDALVTMLLGDEAMEVRVGAEQALVSLIQADPRTAGLVREALQEVLFSPETYLVSRAIMSADPTTTNPSRLSARAKAPAASGPASRPGGY